jgi:hypothetical protein
MWSGHAHEEDRDMPYCPAGEISRQQRLVRGPFPWHAGDTAREKAPVRVWRTLHADRTDACVAELGWKIRWADKFFLVQHINCQFIIEI